VWLNVLPGDNARTARRAAARLFPGSEVRNFYDPDNLAGRVMARGLGAQEGQVAWDIYLFYPAGSEWFEVPPVPSEWVHQLRGSDWADGRHLRSGGELVRALHEAAVRDA
jgi:hypothetical protein